MPPGYQDMEKTATENINEKLIPNVISIRTQQGKPWIKQQKGIYEAVRLGKGKYARMTFQTRKNMMIRIEKKVFGRSPTLEHDKKQFQEWFKETFGHEYKET